MLAVILWATVGGLFFQGQDLDGLRLSPVKMVSQAVGGNFRQADFDGDGAMDLVLVDGVYFQRNGGYPPTSRIDFPAMDAPCTMDVGEGALYCMTPSHFCVYRWEKGAWHCTIKQTALFTWPNTSSMVAPHRNTKPRFARFLNDFDGDTIPEVIRITMDEVTLYQLQQEQYVEKMHLPILPQLRLSKTPEQSLWPPSSRGIVFPARQMTCRLAFDSNRITVLQWEENAERALRYSFRMGEVAVEQDPWEWREDSEDKTQSEWMPRYMQACHLNKNHVLDYAGGRWVLSDASAFPRLLYETSWSLDGAANIQVRRTSAFQGFRPHCLFIDYDGDGDKDLISESTHLFDSGFREALIRVFTRKSLTHEVCVYTQAQGQFAKSPTFQVRCKIQLQEPLFRGGEMLRRYQASQLVNFTGDFNGDGYRDLLIQPETGTLAVYLGAFSVKDPKKPDALLAVRQGSQFGVADVNGDGRTDVVTWWMLGEGETRQERTHVFFSQEDAP